MRIRDILNILVETFSPTLREGPFIDGRIVPRLSDGSTPSVLYRVMSSAEFQAGTKSGLFRPRPGERIHAAPTPHLQYCEPGEGNVLVRFDYVDEDGWQAKWTSTEVVAITSQAIPASRVTMVAAGTKQDLARAA